MRPSATPCVERQRDRRRRGVGVALDGDDHLVGRQLQPLADRVDDPPVGLVRHQPVEVGRGRSRPGRARSARRRPARRRRSGTPRGRSSADGRWCWSRTGRRRHRDRRSAGRRRRDGWPGCRDRARVPGCSSARSTTAPAPSPNRTQVPRSCPVEDAREGLGADHQRGPRLARRAGSCRPSPARRRSRRRPPAGRRRCAGRCRACAAPRSRSPGRCGPASRWRPGSGRRPAADSPARVERHARGGDGEVGGELALGREVALADAGPLADPLVGGVDACATARRCSSRAPADRRRRRGRPICSMVRQDAAACVAAGDGAWMPPISSMILSLVPLRTRSAATAIAAAKPSGVGAAVALHHHAVQAQEHGAVVAPRVELARAEWRRPAWPAR